MRSMLVKNFKYKMCMFKKNVTLRSWRAFKTYISYTFYFYTKFCFVFVDFLKHYHF